MGNHPRQGRRKPLRFLGRDERGGVLVVVTLLLGGCVLLGMGAYVVDVGQIYGEREQLQSGADAAAMALAKSCSTDPGSCASKAGAVTGGYADDNAKDGTSSVTLVCGTAPGLSACPAQATGLSGCVGTTIPSTPYVEVRLGTRNANGTTLLPPTFGRALPGNPYGGGRRYAACARTTYAPLNNGVTKAFTVSQCEFDDYLGAHANRLPPPPATLAPSTTYERVFYAHNSHTASGCGSSYGGSIAGGFGFLPDDASKCHSNVTLGATITNKTPTSDAEDDCTSGFNASRTQDLVLLVGLYDTVTQSGSNYKYHMVGLTGFVVTGYYWSTGSQKSSITNTNYCSGSQRCIYGYFTGKDVVGGGTSLGRNFGASVISTVG